MNAPNAQRPTLKPVAELLGDAVLLCLRHAQPLVVTATAGALVGVGFGALATPGTDGGRVLWGQFIGAVVLGLQAPVWMFVSFANEGSIVDEESPLAYAVGVYVGLKRLGLEFFVLGLVIGTWTSLGAMLALIAPQFSLAWLMPLAYVGIRFSLAGASITRETSNPFVALARSWRLVQGRWWRTLGAQLPVLTLSAMLVFAADRLEAGTGSRAVGALATGAALGLSAPLVAAVSTALFLDYRKADVPPPSPPAQEPPAPDDGDG